MGTMNLNVRRGFAAGTKMSSIEVPSALRIKRLSGIDWLDEAFGGKGFTPTMTTMLTGGPGCGKSTLLRQMASAFQGEGYVVVYNSGEENLFQSKLSCERLGLEHLDFQVAEETHLPTLLTFLDQVKLANPNKQLVYLQDSLQTLDDGKYSNGTNGMTPVRCACKIVDWTQANFALSFFIGQATKSGEFAGKNEIKHAVDAHAQLYRDKAKKSPTFGQLFFEVPKNRWGVTGEAFLMTLGGRGLSADNDFDFDAAAE